MRQEGEPSVEEILDSIKKVIARDSKAAQQQAAELREVARSEAAAEYTDAIQVFRKNSEQQIKDAVALIDQEQQAARQELRGQVEAIAVEIASKALGRRIA